MLVSTFTVANFESLYCNQEEADTRMILHACYLSQEHMVGLLSVVMIQMS